MNLFNYLMNKNDKNLVDNSHMLEYLLNRFKLLTASGIELNINAKKTKIEELIMTKESTQDGTPTPDNPVEIQTVKGYRNLLPKAVTSEEKNGLTFTVNQDGSIKVSGTATATSYYNLTKQTLQAGTYRLSGGINNTCNIVSKYGSSYQVDNGNGNTFTLSEETTPTEFYIQITNGTVISTPIIFYPMIIEGTEEKPYVPYGTNWIYTEITNGTDTNYYTIPLGNNEIAGIGDYKDELIVDSNGHCWLNKKIGKIILDGSENWFLSNNNRFFAYRSNIFPLTNNPDKILSTLSNYYIPTSYNNIYNATVDYGYGFGSSEGRIDIRNKDITVLADFKTWLSTHNTEVLYPLETPDPIDLNYDVDIRLFKGNNTITNSDDMTMVLKYYS